MNLKFFISIVVYVFCLHYGYENYILPTWGYMGYFKYSNLDWSLKLYELLIIILPSFFTSKEVHRISQFFYLFIYILIYIPTIIVISHSWTGDYNDFYFFTLSYFVSILIISFSSRLKLKPFKLFKIPAKKLVNYFFYISLICISYIFLKKYDSLQLVDFTNSIDVYKLREENSAPSSFDGYITLLTASLFLPFLTASSIKFEKYFYLIFSFLGFIILFSIGANKSYLFTPFLILLVYKIIEYFKKGLNSKIVILFSLVVLILSFSMKYGGVTTKLILFFPSAFFLFRTIFTGGWQSLVYYDFFNNPSNELTYLSQTKFFNLLSEYPYDDLLGNTVGYYAFSDENLSLNANFLISDGFASFWFLGIILITVLYSIIFYIIDCVSIDFDLSFVVSCTFFSIISLSNTSLFTTLLSGGLFITTLIFSITKIKTE